MVSETEKSKHTKSPWLLSGWFALVLDIAWIAVDIYVSGKASNEAMKQQTWENCGKLISGPRWEHAAVWIFFVIAIALVLFSVAGFVWKVARRKYSSARKIARAILGRILPMGVVLLFAIAGIYSLEPFRDICGG
jgi:hypothetical protein